jgi:hypothetical protein
MDNTLQRTLAITLAGVIAGAATAAASIEYHDEPTGVRARPSDSDRGSNWVAECLSNDAQLFAESRLRRQVFDALVGLVIEGGVHSGQASVEEKLLIFLYICGNGASYRNVKYRCGRSLQTVSV